MKNKYLLATLAMILITKPSVFADSDVPETRGIDHVNKASDASFDKRLPPVLPGEEVGDGENRIKVWSTSGSLAANPAPQPPRPPRPPAPPAPVEQNLTNDGTLGSIGVIVDQRNDHDNTK